MDTIFVTLSKEDDTPNLNITQQDSLITEPTEVTTLVLSLEQERQIIMCPVGEKGDKGDSGMTPEDVEGYIELSLQQKFYDAFDEQLFI